MNYVKFDLKIDKFLKSINYTCHSDPIYLNGRDIA